MRLDNAQQHLEGERRTETLYRRTAHRNILQKDSAQKHPAKGQRTETSSRRTTHRNIQEKDNAQKLPAARQTTRRNILQKDSALKHPVQNSGKYILKKDSTQRHRAGQRAETSCSRTAHRNVLQTSAHASAKRQRRRQKLQNYERRRSPMKKTAEAERH